LKEGRFRYTPPSRRLSKATTGEAEVSSTWTSFFSADLEGRAHEQKYQDHSATDSCFEMERWHDERLVKEEIPMRNAMNEVLREAYIADNLEGIEYWNRECEKAGMEFRFVYPHRRFNRTIGEFAGATFDPSGDPIDASTFADHRDEWLPTAADKAFVKSLTYGWLR